MSIDKLSENNIEVFILLSFSFSSLSSLPPYLSLFLFLRISFAFSLLLLLFSVIIILIQLKLFSRIILGLSLLVEQVTFVTIAMCHHDSELSLVQCRSPDEVNILCYSIGGSQERSESRVTG